MTVDAFIARMLAMFGAPNTADEDVYIAEVRKALSGWRGDILAEAADRLVRTAKWFPKPAEVIEICEAIAGSRQQREATPQQSLDWSREAIGRANYLIHSDMGRQAATEGWIGELHDYCRRHRTLPPPADARIVKAKGLATQRAIDDCEQGRGGLFGPALARLGRSLRAKHAQLADIANGQRKELTHLSDLSRRMSGEGAEGP